MRWASCVLRRAFDGARRANERSVDASAKQRRLGEQREGAAVSAIDADEAGANLLCCRNVAARQRRLSGLCRRLAFCWSRSAHESSEV